MLVQRDLATEARAQQEQRLLLFGKVHRDPGLDRTGSVGGDRDLVARLEATAQERGPEEQGGGAHHPDLHAG